MPRIIEEPKVTSPLIIGGVGGSGTRIYREIAVLAGFDMLVGPWVIRVRRPKVHDNWPLRKFFYPKWVTPYLRNELGWFGKMRMRAACRTWLWLCGPVSYNNRQGKKWGWKNPSTMFLIPFFKELYPAMRFIHVVRDGRDHAFHPQFQYIENHNRLVYRENELKLEDYLRKGAYWSRCHELIEKSVTAHLSEDQYLISRFEDLCTDPMGEVTRIFAFLGSSDQQLIEKAVSLVRTPASYNRWRNESAERLRELEHLIGNDLARYGYPLTTRNT